MTLSKIISAVGVAALIATTVVPAEAGNRNNRPHWKKNHAQKVINRRAARKAIRQNQRRALKRQQRRAVKRQQRRNFAWNGGPRRQRRHNNGGHNIAPFIIGGIGLAILGATIAQRNYGAPAYVATTGPRPWSRAWYRYCYNNFPNFNPKTGYYITQSGRYQFCQ